MEDKASCSASSSKDFNSLISTNSAMLAPPQRHADALRDITGHEQAVSVCWQ